MLRYRPGPHPWRRGWQFARLRPSGPFRRPTWRLKQVTAKPTPDTVKLRSDIDGRVGCLKRVLTSQMAPDPLSFSALCCGLLPCLPVSDDQRRDLARISFRVWPRRRRDRAARVNLLPGVRVDADSHRGLFGSPRAASG